MFATGAGLLIALFAFVATFPKALSKDAIGRIGLLSILLMLSSLLALAWRTLP